MLSVQEGHRARYLLCVNTSTSFDTKRFADNKLLVVLLLKNLYEFNLTGLGSEDNCLSYLLDLK